MISLTGSSIGSLLYLVGLFNSKYSEMHSDQNCTQNSARGWWAPRGWVGMGVQGVVWGLGG